MKYKVGIIFIILLSFNTVLFAHCGTCGVGTPKKHHKKVKQAEK